MFIIGGIQKTTLVDFPGKVAAIVFTQGCNFRCGYCHNPSLLAYTPLEGGLKSVISGWGINSKTHLQHTSKRENAKDFFSFLQTRIGKLDGVVITGGEPTLQSGLYDFIKEIKQMGFEVKLDTNGTNPQIIEQLIKDNLLDYIAMDIKAPIEKYDLITAVKTNKANILKTIELIKNNNVDYEFRTTVLKSQLSHEDFNQIGQMIKGAKRYYLQKFVPSEILNKNLLNEQTYTNEEFKTICENLKKYIEFVDYR